MKIVEMFFTVEETMSVRELRDVNASDKFRNSIGQTILRDGRNLQRPQGATPPDEIIQPQINDGKPVLYECENDNLQVVVGTWRKAIIDDDGYFVKFYNGEKHLKVIGNVQMHHLVDEYADLSYLGEYCNDSGHEEEENPILRKNWRKFGSLLRYYDKATGKTHYFPETLSRDGCGYFVGRHDFGFFKPANCILENFKYYYKNEKGKFSFRYARKMALQCVMQDLERMEAYNRGDWYTIGIRAEAKIYLSTDGGESWCIQKMTTPGTWGVESDMPYKEKRLEFELEQLQELFELILASEMFERSELLNAFSLTLEHDSKSDLFFVNDDEVMQTFEKITLEPTPNAN